MGIAINAKSKNKEAAKKLLEWMASAEFAELFSNAVPGFFSPLESLLRAERIR